MTGLRSRRLSRLVPATATAGPTRALVAAALFGLIAAARAPATAAPMLATLVTEVGGVGIVAPDSSDPVVQEAASRLRSELRLVGLESNPIGCHDEGAREVRVCAGHDGERTDGDETDDERPAGASGSGVVRAIIGLSREHGVMAIQVVERLENGSKFFRLVYVPAREGGDDPAVLAVHAVELLRDLHMDVERNRTALAATAPPTVPAGASSEAPPPGPVGRWRLGATAGLLQGRNGLGPRVAPVVAVARGLGPRLSVSLLASGPYYQDLNAGGTEHTSSRQELAALGLRATLQTGRLRPYGTVAAGALHLVANGHSDQPDAITRQQSLWSALLVGGVGVDLALTRLIALVAEADLLAALPAGQIAIRDQVVGTSGAPSALFQLGVWATLP